MKLYILTNSRELISNTSIAFQTYSPKCPNLLFLLWTIFCISAILRVLISNITTVFQVYGQNTEIRHFWFHFMLLLLSLLLFCSIFSIWINSRVLISNMALAFSNFSLKILKRAFLVQIPILFYILINSRVLISNMAIIFQTYSPKLYK